MSQLNEQHFPADFIPGYIKNNPGFGKKRILTYTIFRFFSAAGADDKSLPMQLKDKLSCTPEPKDYAAIENFLWEDDYFSPSLNPDSFDPLLLYYAVSIAENFSSSTKNILESLMASICPSLYSVDFAAGNRNLSSMIQTEAEFYTALYLILTRYSDSLKNLLPELTAVYQNAFRFTCEDFILYDFMNEYFETKNCCLHPSFLELTDVLVTAVLNYYQTDFKQLAFGEIPPLLNGTASKFAGIKRFGSAALSGQPDHKKTCIMLEKLFRYAAVYELRSNLFDFHLEDDKLITLDNWKTKLRWHYVQYSNVYELAMSAFYASVLSGKLLQSAFKTNLFELTGK